MHSIAKTYNHFNPSVREETNQIVKLFEKRKPRTYQELNLILEESYRLMTGFRYSEYGLYFKSKNSDTGNNGMFKTMAHRAQSNKAAHDNKLVSNISKKKSAVPLNTMMDEDKIKLPKNTTKERVNEMRGVINIVQDMINPNTIYYHLQNA